jgi:lysophospholipase L1-like esterase
MLVRRGGRKLKNTFIVLIGDSIFDNAAYTGGRPSVSQHLHDLLAPDREASLLARDGATTADIPGQIRRLKELKSQGHRIEHVFLPVGGNDALQRIGILERPAHHVAGALQQVDELVQEFRNSYSAVLTDVQRATLEIGAKLTACTTSQYRVG